MPQGHSDQSLKDKIQVFFAFSKDNRYFTAQRHKSAWAIIINKSFLLINGVRTFDKFMFTDKVYYASEVGLGQDYVKKANFKDCFLTFSENVSKACYKIDNEILSVKWTKGIVQHDFTYPTEEDIFYENVAKLTKNK